MFFYNFWWNLSITGHIMSSCRSIVYFLCSFIVQVIPLSLHRSCLPKTWWVRSSIVKWIPNDRTINTWCSHSRLPVVHSHPHRARRPHPLSAPSSRSTRWTWRITIWEMGASPSVGAARTDEVVNSSLSKSLVNYTTPKRKLTFFGFAKVRLPLKYYSILSFVINITINSVCLGHMKSWRCHLNISNCFEIYF